MEDKIECSLHLDQVFLNLEGGQLMIGEASCPGPHLGLVLVPMMAGLDYLRLDSGKNVIEGVYRILVGRMRGIQSDHLRCS